MSRKKLKPGYPLSTIKDLRSEQESLKYQKDVLKRAVRKIRDLEFKLEVAIDCLDAYANIKNMVVIPDKKEDESSAELTNLVLKDIGSYISRFAIEALEKIRGKE
jgi:hypothetical protein